MSLEFEKLTSTIQTMSSTALRRAVHINDYTDQLHEKIEKHSADWEWIETALTQAEQLLDQQAYRSARPLEYDEPLTHAEPPPSCPDQATLIGCDGSQILPDRHSPFLYSVINIGLILYHHGSDQAPLTLTVPFLDFPQEEIEDDLERFAGASVSVRRDLEEMNQVATLVEQSADLPRPLVAMMDQRLAYWPIGDTVGYEKSLQSWTNGMKRIQNAGGMVIGYVDRPNSVNVINLLRTLDVGNKEFDERDLIRRPNSVTDLELFHYLLPPGTRSKVFGVIDNSIRNQYFKQAGQEICFFYYRPIHSVSNEIARIDLPLWIARSPERVAQIHALVHQQCQLLGGYPYILTRADEIAVVGHQERLYLEQVIAVEMQRKGLESSVTAKQMGKEWARAGKTRYKL